MKFIISLLVFASTSLSFANDNVSSVKAEQPSSEVLANIQQGNMQIGGGFWWEQNSEGRSTERSYSIYPSVEYFVLDNLSLGGTLTYSYGEYITSGIGPSLSYYFFKDGKIAAHLSQVLSFTKYSGMDGLINEAKVNVGTTSVGVKYFAAPQVAFGVALANNYEIGSQPQGVEVTGVEKTSLAGSFSFYY